MINTKGNKIIHWISTGLLTALMTMSAGMYFFNHSMVVEAFTALGYPTYIIYPLAVAKIAGLIVLWSPKLPVLKQWAYAGFFFNLVLATSAHLMVHDGEFWAALVGLFLLGASYLSKRKV